MTTPLIDQLAAFARRMEDHALHVTAGGVRRQISAGDMHVDWRDLLTLCAAVDRLRALERADERRKAARRKAAPRARK